MKVGKKKTVGPCYTYYLLFGPLVSLFFIGLSYASFNEATLEWSAAQAFGGPCILS